MLKKAFLGAAAGAIIEYYDFALFTIFLPIFAPLFFPADSVYHSLVKGYFVLLIAMIARPLGGLFFGYFGDKFGRRKTLIASIYGIVSATIIIGLTPSYANIGVSATIIIFAAKALQVFCFGGEYNGAGIFVIEHMQNKNEALAGSLYTSVAFLGALIASLVGIALTSSKMPTWSWRIAFIIGGFIGLLGIYYRTKLTESPDFLPANSNQSLRHLIKLYPRELLAGFFIGGSSVAPFTTVLMFINPLLMVNGYFTHHQLMVSQAFVIFIGLITFLPAGIIADKTSPQKVMRWSLWAVIIFSYPLLSIASTGNVVNIIIAMALLTCINEFFHGPSHAYSKNLFLMQYRFRASSLGFGIGVSLLGSLTPIVENLLYQKTGEFSSSYIWLAFLAASTLLTMHFVSNKQSITTAFDTPVSLAAQLNDFSA